MPERDPTHEPPIPLGDELIPEAPDLPGRVVVRGEFEDTIDAACSELYVHATECARAFGSVHLALSAGGPQDLVYQRLMVDPKFRDLPWAMAHIWIVGEGQSPAEVPPEDPGPAFHTIRETLIDHSGVPEAQVHPIMGADPDAPGMYAAELRRELEWREPGHDRLDAAVLGAEHLSWADHADAREAPLVAPGDPVFEGEFASVRMTTRLLRATRHVSIMARGALAHTDVSRLVPDGGQLVWFLDAEAARSAEHTNE